MKYARLDEGGAILEYREFASRPADIPHKGVRWRPVVEDAEPAGFDPLLHALCAEIVFDEQAQCVRTVKTLADRPIEPERDRAIARTWRAYRDRIIDALPDMGEVARLAGERDRKIAALAASSDLRMICEAAPAATVSKYA